MVRLGPEMISCVVCHYCPHRCQGESSREQVVRAKVALRTAEQRMGEEEVVEGARVERTSRAKVAEEVSSKDDRKEKMARVKIELASNLPKREQQELPPLPGPVPGDVVVKKEEGLSKVEAARERRRVKDRQRLEGERRKTEDQMERLAEDLGTRLGGVVEVKEEPIYEAMVQPESEGKRAVEKPNVEVILLVQGYFLKIQKLMSCFYVPEVREFLQRIVVEND